MGVSSQAAHNLSDGQKAPQAKDQRSPCISERAGARHFSVNAAGAYVRANTKAKHEAAGQVAAIVIKEAEYAEK